MEVCSLCEDFKDKRELIELKCKHLFCLLCINKYLQENLSCKMKCPIGKCSQFIRDAEIRSNLSDEDVARYESLCLSGIKKNHKCILEDCSLTVIYTDANRQYKCPSCTVFNCICCKAAHAFTKCEEYRRMKQSERDNVCKGEIERAMQILCENKTVTLRNMLLSLEEVDLIANNKAFLCRLCETLIRKGDGTMLRNCSHTFCESCLCDHITMNTEIPIKCPESNCENSITDREIESILSPKQWEDYLFRCNEASVNKLVNHVTCKTPNCGVSYDYSTKPNEFTCAKCGKITCVLCATVHSGESCEEYLRDVKRDPTLLFTEKRIKEGKLMRCPGCKIIVEKTEGCNWIQCSNCSLELCWKLQMPRWGPKGKGDISGGCKCGVNRRKCHPECGGCIPHGGNPTQTPTPSTNSWCNIM